jgi:hypothetical protein
MEATSRFTQLQKRHKAVVKVMNGIVKYFDNYTDPTNDPAALAADASATTSTGINQTQRETAALVDTAMELRPAELHTDTNGDSIATSPTASTAALAADASATTSTESTKRNGKPLRLLTPPWSYGRLNCTPTPTAIRSRHRRRHQLRRSQPMQVRPPRR